MLRCGPSNGTPAIRAPRRLASALCVVAVCLVVAPLSAQVFVSTKSGHKGQGVLRKRDSECFLITPRHVATRVLGGGRDTVNRMGSARTRSGAWRARG